MADGSDASVRVPLASAQGPAEAGVAPPPLVPPSPDALKLEKRRRKMRSAWIAFAGRILAQLIGAVATVMLGVYVLRTFGVERAARPSIPAVASPAPASSPPSRTRLALVVLPFQAFQAVRADDAFGDGLTESLIAELSRTADLQVISRTSSMAYKATAKPMPTIVRELGVDLVVEGSVARDGERLRARVQLIDASSDTHLWSHTYERTGRDFLVLQADLTREIGQDLHAAITVRQDEVVADRAGIDAEAHDAYLRGRHAFHRRTPGDLLDATTHFSRVVARAPRFAPAHAALAQTWCLRALDAFGAPAARQALDKAEAAAVDALRLDSSSADAHLALAMVRHRRDWDWAGAEREFIRAFDLHESHPTGHQWYSIFLAEQGRVQEAGRQAARAIALDPRAAPVHRTAGLVALYAGRTDDATAALRQSLELDPAAGVTRLLLAAVLLEQGGHEEARAQAAVVRDAELQDQRLALLAHAAVAAGDRAAALRYRDQARALPGARSLAAEARFALALGDAAALVQSAASAVQARTQLACALKVHPVFRTVRTRPDFQGLMRQVGLS